MGIRIAGKAPSGNHREQLKKSPNYGKGGFTNLIETPMMADDASYWKMLKDFFKKNELKAPPGLMPTVKTDLKTVTIPQPSVTWFGHSSYLLRLQDKNILVDPVFSGQASPVRFMVNAFPGTDIYKPADMPDIDCLILTHDHYDHLDFKTLVQLKTKVANVYCSLGVGSHLRYWGYDENLINEMDWWESKQINESMVLTAAPARHFSGRGVKRGQTLWSSFALKTSSHSIYIGGDSGYDTHFIEIGNKLGPFDLAILECGQYNAMWPFIHMMPEETVQASIDLKAKTLLPVHWGKFSLSMHPWNESIIRAKAMADKLNVDLRMPKIGETLLLNEPYSANEWWKF